MMDAVSRFRKGRSALLGLTVLAAVLAACLPEPDESIEYLQRPDSIIIQMINVRGSPRPELASPEPAVQRALRDFTLYGDGTLIFTRPDGSGSPRLLQAQLPEKAIRDLLEFIADEGFLDFIYDQPRPASVDDAAVTFLYVNTKEGANASRGYGLGSVTFDDAGEEWEQLRRLEKIRQRLDDLDPEALGGHVLGDYQYDEIALFVQELRVNLGFPQQPSWPLAEVELASLAQPGSGIVKHVLGVDQASDLIGDRLAGLAVFMEGGRYFNVGYRPLLPFEENFPLFD